MPYTPGAVLGPNSKTNRSNPGLCAIRMAVSCAWLAGAPPVSSGQALAGVLPGLAAAVGVGAGVVGAAVVGAAVTRPRALALDRGRTTRSGPQALTATTAMAMRRAP